jgi:magnesium transporter
MTEPSHSLDQLLLLLGRHQFLIWLIGTFLIVALLIITAWFQERLNPRPHHRMRLALGMAYGGISGILSAHCLLLAKSAVELLVRTIVDHHNQFNRWQSWMILIGLVLLAVAQLYYLHRGLKLCSTSVLYPFVFCIYNIIAILDGLIYFHQTSRLTPLHAGLIALGTAILLCGVFALSWRLDPEHQVGIPTDSKAAARVPTPRSALVPGMGLVATNATVAGDDSDTETRALLRPSVEEEQSQLTNALSTRATENTPLLRNLSAPVWRLSKRPRKNSWLRPPKMRRLTVPEETTDLWDELNNDSNEVRRFSGALSPGALRSPAANRSASSSRLLSGKGAGNRLKRADTMPSSSTAGRDLFNRVAWPWWQRSNRGFFEGDNLSPPVEEGESTDEAEQEGTVRRNRGWSAALRDQRRRSEGNLTQTARGGWFKLRWWKKRWRPEDDSDGQEDG